jgi:AcrR family transcriptional regulator
MWTTGRIHDAARWLLNEKGPKGVTLRAVAREARVAPSAVYKHYRNKDKLLDAVVSQGMGDLQAQMLRGHDQLRSQRGLWVMIDTVAEFAVRHPHLFELMMRPQPLEDTAYAILRVQVERCIRASTMSRDDPAEIALMLWAQMRGLLALRHECAAPKLLALYQRSMRRLLRLAA